jgi:hypothetical protein
MLSAAGVIGGTGLIIVALGLYSFVNGRRLRNVTNAWRREVGIAELKVSRWQMRIGVVLVLSGLLLALASLVF